MRCTFLGHSTLLLEGKGPDGPVRVLTDPLLTPRVMLRRRALPLPPVDFASLAAVTISHAHADHLHLPSLALLPRNCMLVVPEKTARFVRKLGFREVVELGWEKSLRIGACTMTAWPAHHVRGRFFPWQDTGVNSYVISMDGHDFFAAGDIDFGAPPESELASRFSLSAAALPVGGMREVAYYEKRRGQAKVHIDPAAAWELFLSTRARTMVPIHWGAIRFARTPVTEPVTRLLEIAAAAGRLDCVRVLQPGETWDL